MARTGRNGTPSASMDALDNIDLDGMFADDGDDLFDGLDIDLDMGVMAGSIGDSNSQDPSASGALHLQQSSTQDESFIDSSTTSRRTRKRKTKTPSFLNDAVDPEFLDEPAPAKKKKRKTKASPKRKGSNEETRAMASVPDKQRGKFKNPSEISQPHFMQGSSVPYSFVASAGQFGGRPTKRETSYTVPKAARAKLPMVGSKNKGRENSHSANNAVAATLAEIRASHPGLKQGSFCGIQPSNTLFYPFLPTLPTEPTMKTRKVYPLVDRIHTSFVGHLQSSENMSEVKTAKELEPIFQLMAEAYKEDKPIASTSTAEATNSKQSRVETVGNAIGAIRKTISSLGVPDLAADWYAVCALLQRQHDFLKQNAENMERWCKKNMTEADYSAVYLEPDDEEEKNSSKKQNSSDVAEHISTLMSFGRNEFRVNLHYSGLKQPKGLGPLSAKLPLFFLPESMRESKAIDTSKKTKKRNFTTSLTDGAKCKKGEASDLSLKIPPPATYSTMKPARRRKQMGDLLSQTASELENAYLHRLDVRREKVDQQEIELRKLVEEDAIQVSHTTGMWKWVEMSGYFQNPCDPDIRRLLDDMRSPESTSVYDETDRSGHGGIIAPSNSSRNVVDSVNESLFDRLQSLLVQEDGDDMDDCNICDLDFQEHFMVNELVDLSNLTVDERTCLHLRALGLGEPMLLNTTIFQENSIFCNNKAHFPTTNNLAIKINSIYDEKGMEKLESSYQSINEKLHDPPKARTHDTMASSDAILQHERNELDEVIKAMTLDLVGVNEINNRQISFLEAVAIANSVPTEEQKKKNLHESALISRWQSLLKRTKEIKAKNGNTMRKDDSLALPW